MLCGICLSSESVNIEIVRFFAQQPERKRKTHERTPRSWAPRFHRITSNRAVDEWVALFDDPILANSALDRFAHRAHQIVMEAPACAPLAPPALPRAGGAPPKTARTGDSQPRLLRVDPGASTALAAPLRGSEPHPQREMALLGELPMA